MPKKLVFTAHYINSPPFKDDRLFLRAKLNGVMVASKGIEKGGEDSFSFDVPAEFIKSQNFLELVFSYYINRGECKGSIPELEVSLLGDSFFTAVKPSSEAGIVNFDNVAGLLNGQGVLVLDDSYGLSFVGASLKLAEKSEN